MNPTTNPEEDDFLKRLLGDSAAIIEPPAPAKPAKPAYVPPPPSKPSAASPVSEISIEDLLRETANVTAPAAPALPPPPMPSLGANTAQTAPPNLPPPPLPFSFVPPDAPPPPSVKAKPKMTFDRGYFYYDNTNGQPVLLGPASFTTRLVGAIIDAVLASILVWACRLAIDPLLMQIFTPELNSLLRDIQQASNSRNTAAIISVLNRAQDLTSTLSLVSGLVGTVLSLIYYVVLVGLFGKTIGHLAMGITIRQANGNKAGMAAAFLRAIYGSLGTLAFLVAIPTIFSLAFGAVIGSALGAKQNFDTLGYIAIALLILQLVIAFGLFWMTKDDYKQGWHDKLAGTYAIKNKPIKVESV